MSQTRSTFASGCAEHRTQAALNTACKSGAVTRTWLRELSGWFAATAIGIALTAQVAAVRGDLLFRDGDSLVVALVTRSLFEGRGADWAMSSVLFLPEIAVFSGLWALLGGLGVNAVLVVNAVLNVLGLYGALRLVAGRRRRGRSPVLWSVIALIVYAALAATETSASRDALETASLLLTTTYYSATVIAVVATVGIARRVCDRPAGGRIIGPLVALGVIAGVATLSNPLYAAWATVPLGVVLSLAALRHRMRDRMLRLIWVLIGATVAGLLLRLPLGPWIANDGSGYAQPQLWPQAAANYARLAAERLSTPLGWIALVIVAGLIVLAVRRSIRPGERGARLVAASGWMLPLLVAIGAIGLGTDAARYLSPVLFAPVLALVADPRAVRLGARRAARVLAAAAAVVLLAGAAVSVPRAANAAHAPDADLACVVDWVDASDAVGAGQFWTVRLPKLHVEDPSRLVQVDHRLNGYAWLADRADFDSRTVTFLIGDEQSTPWELPMSAPATEVIECGRYVIFGFVPEELPLGPAHS